MARRSAAEYVEMASKAIIELLRAEHAVLWSEAQAKISDARWPTLPTTVDPHHMTTARSALIGAGRIAVVETRTRGGTVVPVLHLKDTKGISKAIETAGQRKRALMATLNSWTHPRPGYKNGFVGEAGERVAYASLLEAAPHGLRLERPGGGEVTQLLGNSVPGGPLDSSVWAQVTNEVGLTVETVLCPIEVKNIRHWVYPSARELHQLLHKAALLQASHEDVFICPILITRKKSFTANEMSRELGFRILDVNKQSVLPVKEVDLNALERMRVEFGFTDLVAQDTADSGLVGALRSVPRTALPNALRWKTFGPELADHFEVLRQDMSATAREDAMSDLRDAVRELGGEARW